MSQRVRTVGERVDAKKCNRGTVWFPAVIRETQVKNRNLMFLVRFDGFKWFHDQWLPAHQVRDAQPNYRSMLRRTTLRRANQAMLKPQDISNVFGDENRLFEVGEIVWAKYGTFTWWPGQVMQQKDAVRVRWYGQNLAVHWNECKPASVVGFEASMAYRFVPMLATGDQPLFEAAVEEGNDAYLRWCSKNGQRPLQSALLFTLKTGGLKL